MANGNSKNRLAAAILQIFIGFGIGRFYMNDSKIGVLQLVTTLFFGFGRFWCLIDGIMILCDKNKLDGNGNPME
ncbi:MAG: TM2 domain-containing protein [bacterium]